MAGWVSHVLVILQKTKILKCRHQHLVFPGRLRSKYWPSLAMLNFSDQTRTGVFMAVWSVTIYLMNYCWFLIFIGTYLKILKCHQHLVFPGRLRSKYWPSLAMLNFSDQTRTGVFMAVWSVTIYLMNYCWFLIFIGTYLKILKCRHQHLVFPGRLRSKYWPSLAMLNFSDQTRTGVFMAVWSVTDPVTRFGSFVASQRKIFSMKS